MSGFSMHDVKFRRTDASTSATSSSTARSSAPSWGAPTSRTRPAAGSTLVHLYDDRRGPRQVKDRDAVRGAIASMLVERGLVPPMPPPTHPDHAARRRHRPA